MRLDAAPWPTASSGESHVPADRDIRGSSGGDAGGVSTLISLVQLRSSSPGSIMARGGRTLRQSPRQRDGERRKASTRFELEMQCTEIVLAFLLGTIFAKAHT